LSASSGETPSLPEFAREFRDFDASCGSAAERIVAWAISDSSGHFVLPKLSSNGPHKILVSSYGFDPMRMTVVLRLFARKDLRITMHVAT